MRSEAALCGFMFGGKTMNFVTHVVVMWLMRRARAANNILASGVALFLAVASPCAFAADVPARGPVGAPPVAPSPYPYPFPYSSLYYYNWTGFYVGGNLGVAWDTSALTDDFFGANFGTSSSGFVGGGQIGYNWQISPQFVVGVEWMLDGTSISSDSGTFVGLSGIPFAANERIDWVTTLAARFGWTANNWLFYGKAGGGWVHESETLINFTNPFAISNSDTRGGWLLGVGIEYGFAPRWTARVEWDHIGLSDETIGGFTAGDAVILSRHFDMLTFGVNYRF
jgi:outer membrane immunogenic protein